MIERNSKQSVHSNETSDDSLQPLQRRGRETRDNPASESVLPKDTAGPSSSGIEALPPLALPNVAPVCLQVVAPNEGLPRIASPAQVAPLPFLSSRTATLQPLSMYASLPKFTSAEADSLSLPSMLPRRSFQSVRPNGSLPEILQYTFSCLALPLPISLSVQLVPRRASQTLPRLSPVARAVPTQREVEAMVQTEVSTAGESNASSEVGSLLDCLFEEATGKATGGQFAGDGRSHLILAIDAFNKSKNPVYARFLLYSLWQLYRCGYGAAIVQDVVPDLSTEARDHRLADGRITLIENPPSKLTDLTQRFSEMMGASPAVTVVPIPEGEAELWQNLGLQEGLHGVSVDVLRLRHMVPEKWVKVLEAAYGYLQGKISLPDQTSSSLEGEFHKQLSSRWKHLPSRLLNPSDQQRGDTLTGQESELHCYSKWYVAWLYRDLAESCNIETEKKEQIGGGSRIVDVYIGKGPVHYEVETLFGSRGVPASNLNGTVKKYGYEEDIRIVVPNFQCMLFLPDLLRYERDRQRDGYKNLTIWTLDLHNHNARGEEGLKRLRDVAKGVRNLMESVH